jgi:transposase
MELLADELIQRGIVTSISRETISKWLRTADLKPHRLRYWLNSKDPDFKTKRDRVISLYINRPPRGRVICIDEKTSIQALERCAPDKPVRPKSPRKVEFEYRRHGTANLLAAFDVHTGEVVGEIVAKNDSQAFIEFLKRLRKRYPRETLYLILDNGTTHRSHATTEFLARHKRLIPVFLPTHASWLNQVELWFSALSKQALRNASFASRDELVARILQYIEVHNSKAKPYRWTSKGEPLRR